MPRLEHLAILALSFVCAAQGPPPTPPDAAIVCDDCDEWNAPQEPFKVFGNTYYVGVAGLSAILVTSEQGHILLDGGLPQSAPLIEANIRSLGFAPRDVRLIVNSHAHFDHAGGIRALQRATGAVVAASPDGARALERGAPGPDDPQHAYGPADGRFPAVPGVRDAADGETLRAGPLGVTAHHTPGHTPGSTTWTWRSCEGTRCLDFVYADSLNPVSKPGFRFTGDGNRPAIVDAFRRSIARVRSLPCDVLLAVHPGFSGMAGKLKRRAAGAAANPFIDPQGCRAYADDAAQRLDRRVTEEK